MKIEKRVLSGALRVLGKVACQNSPVEEYRSIRFRGGEDSVSVSATDGREWITLDLPCQADGAFDFAIELKTLRERIRHEYGETIELTGKSLPWTDVVPVPDEAVQLVLPETLLHCWNWRLSWWIASPHARFCKGLISPHPVLPQPTVANCCICHYHYS